MPEKRNPLAVQIGHRLRAVREDLGLQQADVASMLRLTTEAYRSYERGWRMLPIEVLIRLPDVFQRSLHYFLGLPDPEGLRDDERLLVRLYRAVQSADIRAFILEMTRRQMEVDAQLRDRQGRIDPAPRVADPTSIPAPRDD